MNAVGAPEVTPQARAGKSAEQTGKQVRRDLLILLAVSGLLFFFRLNCWGFIDPGDGYFSEAAREMMERGDYIVPHLNYQIYFSKPILIYWLIISAYKVLGVTEFAARFWSAALATVQVLVSYLTARSIAGRRAGLLAGIMFGAAPLVVTFARMSLIDMSFSVLLGIALCATAMTLFTNSRRWWPWIYISLGLAVLDKGPAGLILYGIGLAGFLVLCKRKLNQITALLQQLEVAWGALIFSAIAVPWYIVVGIATHGLWPKVFFLFENFGRFAGHTNHKQPSPLFYLPVLAYGFFPWVVFLPGALIDTGRTIYSAWKDKVALAETSTRTVATLLFASWTLGVLLFFSASMTKLQTYVLPAFPGMALWVALTVDNWIEVSNSGKMPGYLRNSSFAFGLLGALCIAAAAVCAIVFAQPSLLSSVPAKFIPLAQSAINDTPGWMRAWSTAAVGFIGLAFAAAGHKLLRGGTRFAITAVAVASVCGCAILGPIAYELGYKYRNADVHAVIESIKNKPGPVAIFHDFKPSVVFHLQRPVDTFFSADQLRPAGGSKQTQYIITGKKGAQLLTAAYPGKLNILAHQGDWFVFDTTQLVALRLPTLEQSHKQHIDLSGGEYGWGMLPFAGGTKP